MLNKFNIIAFELVNKHNWKSFCHVLEIASWDNPIFYCQLSQSLQYTLSDPISHKKPKAVLKGRH